MACRIGVQRCCTESSRGVCTGLGREPGGWHSTGFGYDSDSDRLGLAMTVTATVMTARQFSQKEGSTEQAIHARTHGTLFAACLQLSGVTDSIAAALIGAHVSSTHCVA
jgi:hypothetical protein